MSRYTSSRFIVALVWLDAEYFLVVNPDGTVHRHQKVDGAGLQQRVDVDCRIIDIAWSPQ
ncbi:MAG: hypothetical protein F4X02_11720 [Chloroflexi bacterium]|nr:hypothetical protein [Chloroflexota bacterium]